MNRKLTIYFENGITARFEQVKNVDTEFGNTLRFSYVSASRKDIKVVAAFYLPSIAGFSLDVKVEGDQS